MKEKELRAHVLTTLAYSELSTCKRRHVGCIVVKDNRVISIGYNGTPAGWDNCCEDEHGKTKPEVIHAERNALGKLLTSSDTAKGSTLFVNYRPCHECAIEIVLGQVAEVCYIEHDLIVTSDGVPYLQKNNIKVTSINPEDCIEWLMTLVLQNEMVQENPSILKKYTKYFRGE